MKSLKGIEDIKMINIDNETIITIREETIEKAIINLEIITLKTIVEMTMSKEIIIVKITLVNRCRKTSIVAFPIVLAVKMANAQVEECSAGRMMTMIKSIKLCKKSLESKLQVPEKLIYLTSSTKDKLLQKGSMDL